MIHVSRALVAKAGRERGLRGGAAARILAAGRRHTEEDMRMIALAAPTRVACCGGTDAEGQVAPVSRR